MKFAVDRIVLDTVVLENINTGEIKEVNISELPVDIKESDVLIFEDNIYKQDINEKQNRISLLREKMNKLRGGNNGHE